MEGADEKKVGVDVASASSDEAYASTKQYEEGLGDLQVLKVDGSNVKLHKDGVTVLIPQPSDDPNDPVRYIASMRNVLSN